MSVRQYEPYAAQLGYLSETIHRHLTERECGIFDRGLADYHRRRNVKAFVECLSLVLNTNQKRQLLIPIRDTYVKPSDTGRFNQLVQAHGLATSLKKKRRGEFEADKNKASSDGIHKADVKRDSSGEWGFNIRGGSDQGTGVFVSWVEPESNAHTSGLQVGDQILKANETSFENITHHDAVQVSFIVCPCISLCIYPYVDMTVDIFHDVPLCVVGSRLQEASSLAVVSWSCTHHSHGSQGVPLGGPRRKTNLSPS